MPNTVKQIQTLSLPRGKDQQYVAASLLVLSLCAHEYKQREKEERVS